MISELNDSLDDVSNATEIRNRRTIVENHLDVAVEEICGRKRYNPKYRSLNKNLKNCLDIELDEHIKRMSYLADKKIQNEMDLSRIVKKLRSFG